MILDLTGEIILSKNYKEYKKWYRLSFLTYKRISKEYFFV
jgi:hypothetical protein